MHSSTQMAPQNNKQITSVMCLKEIAVYNLQHDLYKEQAQTIYQGLLTVLRFTNLNICINSKICQKNNIKQPAVVVY
jgi:hypothetical protein